MWVIKLNSSSFLFILFVNIHSQQKQFSRSAHQMSTVSSPQGMTCWIFKELQFPCGCGYTLEICSKFTTKHLLYDVSYIDLLAFYSSVGYSLLRNCEKEVKNCEHTRIKSVIYVQDLFETVGLLSVEFTTSNKLYSGSKLRISFVKYIWQIYETIFICLKLCTM